MINNVTFVKKTRFHSIKKINLFVSLMTNWKYFMDLNYILHIVIVILWMTTIK